MHTCLTDLKFYSYINNILSTYKHFTIASKNTLLYYGLIQFNSLITNISNKQFNKGATRNKIELEGTSVLGFGLSHLECIFNFNQMTNNVILKVILNCLSVCSIKRSCGHVTY